MNAVDLVVVGAGHAGCEAAAAAARLGLSVALVTLRRSAVARLSCNPAVGGLGKGHLVREIDALGGCMARVADATTIQFRRLNTRKGLAVQSSRAQVDIARYPTAMQRELGSLSRLHLVEGEVVEVTVRGARVSGVVLADGTRISTPRVVVTAGTFLGSALFRGDERTRGGRWGEPPADALSRCLHELTLPLQRLKTGTTPRLDGDTVDLSRLQRQQDTVEGATFSFVTRPSPLPRRDCHVAWTRAETHALIRAALDRAPLFSGDIQGTGPRYCPSIEDKVVRFADRERHLLFLEPEGLDTRRLYISGLATSLPRDVQDAVIASIRGLERARIVQYGYAVEYDCVDPRCLGPDLQHRQLRGLYFAGQVCGTSGYEEAAAQGLVTGISAARGEPFRLERHEAYMGVLVDDLTRRGVGGEPYRMFTSRAEYRLTLREDNADRRLTPRGREVGLVDDERWRCFQEKMATIEHLREQVAALRVPPRGPLADRARALDVGPVTTSLTAADLLKRPQVDWSTLEALFPSLATAPHSCGEQVTTDIKYAGYIERDRRRARETRRLAGVRLPPELLEADLPGLSVEIRERLRRERPRTLGEAARLPGVTPAAVHLLSVHLARRAPPGAR